MGKRACEVESGTMSSRGREMEIDWAGEMSLGARGREMAVRDRKSLGKTEIRQGVEGRGN